MLVNAVIIHDAQYNYDGKNPYIFMDDGAVPEERDPSSIRYLFESLVRPYLFSNNYSFPKTYVRQYEEEDLLYHNRIVMGDKLFKEKYNRWARGISGVSIFSSVQIYPTSERIVVFK